MENRGGYLHIPEVDSEAYQYKKTIGGFHFEDELVPGKLILYTKADGNSRYVRVMERPEGVSEGYVYVKGDDLHPNLRGFAAPIPKYYRTEEARRSFEKYNQQIAEYRAQWANKKKSSELPETYQSSENVESVEDKVETPESKVEMALSILETKAQYSRR